MGSIKTVQEVELNRINECIDAICDRFGGAVRPVYGSNDRKLAMHVGSATLLTVAGTPLIVMAAHTVDENEYTALYVSGKTHLVPIESSPSSEHIAADDSFPTAKSYRSWLRPPGGRPVISKDHHGR